MKYNEDDFVPFKLSAFSLRAFNRLFNPSRPLIFIDDIFSPLFQLDYSTIAGRGTS